MVHTANALHPLAIGALSVGVQAEVDPGSNTLGVPETDTGASVPVSADIIPWDDDLMKQLFQCQPSINWLDSDILDPALWGVKNDPIPEAEYSAST